MKDAQDSEKDTSGSTAALVRKTQPDLGHPHRPTQGVPFHSPLQLAALSSPALYPAFLSHNLMTSLARSAHMLPHHPFPMPPSVPLSGNTLANLHATLAAASTTQQRDLLTTLAAADSARRREVFKTLTKLAGSPFPGSEAPFGDSPVKPESSAQQEVPSRRVPSVSPSSSSPSLVASSTGSSETVSPSSPPSTGRSDSYGGRRGTPNGRQERVFTCKICNRSFGYKHVLQNHERTHTGEKPFECKECHKRFTRDHHLKTHMRLHTGEKPYHCSHCDRQFVQVANLRRHLRVHTGERPYMCDMCTSKFSDSNQLKAHTLIHKGEKPFQCSLCMMKFRRRYHMNTHKCSRDPDRRGDYPETTIGADGDTCSVGDEEGEEEDDSATIIEDVPLEKRRGRKCKDPRRVHLRDVAESVHLLRMPLPEQTEPEDLSLSSCRRAYSGSFTSSTIPSTRYGLLKAGADSLSENGDLQPYSDEDEPIPTLS